ncbi:PepSY domain-containing protein [Bacillus sp. PS06]|uniref:PepSY domain-containing protein n=1 Tax=Bacillus sp. PS06 TaxID=2764176 RepID=UPI0017853A7B|nr:PepSY domain-containing protein [Bacillus sp. PS06]MBD8070518.1 PepSY domain-containing protein [Bacillus sp. PS06]
MKKIVTVIIGMGLVIGAGVGVNAMKNNGDDNSVVVTNKVEQTSTATPKKDEATKTIDVEKAKEIALQYVDGEIEEVERKSKDGRTIYKIEVDTRDDDDFDVYVDGQTGEVLNKKKSELVKVTREEAKKIALKEVPGKIEEIELDEEDGFYKYEVEIEADNGKEVELKISAQTGEILKMEWDN